MQITKKILGLSAVAAVAFACSMPALTAAHSANGVKCYGVNKCKGKSACAMTQCKKHKHHCKKGSNSCKGMNSCKGKGWVMKRSEKACTRKGGSVTPPAQH